MNYLIKNVTIFDPKSNLHKQLVDLKIEDGKWKQIGENLSISDDYIEISIPNLYISKGWIDSSVSFGEPGYEERETLKNGLFVAAKSGFTSILLQPNNNPIADNQSQILFAIEKSKNEACTLYPIGALTEKSEGQALAELYDMKNAGAIAFGDYKKAIQNANLQKIALQYVQDFDGLLLPFCSEATIKGVGIVNEGATSTRLGMKGIPELAEALHVSRNLFLLEYTGGKMHIPTISTKESIKLIKEAKTKGLQITCSVSVSNLVLNDSILSNFDSRHKLMPPLRDEETRLALVEAVLDGTIDCITSDHQPIDIEHKRLEFDLAKDGTIGLETAFSALATILPLEVIIDKLTAAKSIFGIPESEIKIGNKADITLFTIEDEWIFQKEDILSKSKNSAFIGQKMKGKSIGIFNNNQLIL